MMCRELCPFTCSETAFLLLQEYVLIVLFSNLTTIFISPFDRCSFPDVAGICEFSYGTHCTQTGMSISASAMPIN